MTRDVTGFVAKPSCYDRSDSPEVLGSKLRPVLNVSLKPLFTPDMIFLLSHICVVGRLSFEIKEG